MKSGLGERACEHILKGLLLTLAGLTVLGLLAAVSLFSSASTYALLYWLLIPTSLHRIPVFFDFSPDCLASAGGPIAVADLLQPQQWTFGHSLLPDLPPPQPLLSARETYDIDLLLTLAEPEHFSDASDTGLVSLAADLVAVLPGPTPGAASTAATPGHENPQLTDSQEAAPPATSLAALKAVASSLRPRYDRMPPVADSRFKILAFANRPVILGHHSWLARRIRELIFAVPSALGWISGTETVRVTLFEDWVEAAVPGGAPTAAARLQLLAERADRLRVSSAELRFRVKLRGLRWLASEWMLSSAFVWISMMFAVQFACWVCFVSGSLIWWKFFSDSHASPLSPGGVGSGPVPVAAQAELERPRYRVHPRSKAAVETEDDLPLLLKPPKVAARPPAASSPGKREHGPLVKRENQQESPFEAAGVSDSR